MTKLPIPAIDQTITHLDAIVQAVPPGLRRMVTADASKVEVKLRAALILLDEVREWMERSGHSDKYLHRMIECVTGRVLSPFPCNTLPGD